MQAYIQLIYWANINAMDCVLWQIHVNIELSPKILVNETVDGAHVYRIQIPVNSNDAQSESCVLACFIPHIHQRILQSSDAIWY